MSRAGSSPPAGYAGLVDELGEPERLALTYATRALRGALAAAFGLDAALQRAALAKSEALLAQIRLAWWREACARLPGATDHPVLAALDDSWHGGPEPLLALVDAWEGIAVAENGFAAATETLAQVRARVLAHCAGVPAGAEILAAVRCWTLATLGADAPDPNVRANLLHRAAATQPVRLPRALRPLAVLAGLARRAAVAGGRRLLGDRASPFVAMRLGIFGR